MSSPIEDLRDRGWALPPPDQVGYVVRSLDRAVAAYEPLFGPFTRMETSLEGPLLRGEPRDCRPVARRAGRRARARALLNCREGDAQGPRVARERAALIPCRGVRVRDARRRLEVVTREAEAALARERRALGRRPRSEEPEEKRPPRHAALRAR